MRHPYKYAAAIILLCITGCAPGARYSHEVREALKELDKTIGTKEIYESRKEAHISDIKSKMASSYSPEDRYGILDRLYQEYCQYNIDSAIFYASTKLDMAQEQGPDNLVNDAVLDLADRYVMSGMYAEVIEMLKGIDYNRLD